MEKKKFRMETFVGIVVAIILILIIVFIGINLWAKSEKKNNEKDASNDTTKSNEIAQDMTPKLTESDIKQLFNIAQDIYLEGDIFIVDEEPSLEREDEDGLSWSYNKVRNYDEIMNKYFTSNGIKNMEKDKERTGLFTKIDGVTYCGEGGREMITSYESINVGNIVYEGNKINAEINADLYEYLGIERTSEIDNIKTNIIFVKEGDSWKIDRYETPDACYERNKDLAINYDIF